MAKRKKRNAVTLVSLLLAMAALIGVYYWYSHRPVKNDTQEVTQTIDLAKIDTAQISSMHYVKDDADIMLVQQDGIWVSKDEPGRPIDQGNVKSILMAIDDIKADRIIAEKPENLADYGLAEPSATLEVTLNDGNVTTVKIGDVAGNSLGYYGLVNADGIVYLLPIEMGTSLQRNNTEMTEIEKAPTITAADITSISVMNREGKDYDLRYDDSKALDNTGNNMYTWKILKPYGEGYTADYSQVETILPNYTTFNFIKNADYSGKNFAQYGLEDPAATIDIGYNATSTEPLATPETDLQTGQTVTEKTTTTPSNYKLYVGSKDADGNYYVRVDGNNSVYTLDAATVDKMLAIDAFSLMNKYICIPNIKTVDKVVFNIEGTEYTMDIKHSIKTNADGTEEDAATYYYNGKEADPTDFPKFYTAIVSAVYDAEAKDVVNTDGLTPYLTMSFHIFGDNEKTVSASIYPYDDSFYVVQKGDGARFLVDKRKIDDIAKAVSTFNSFKK